MLGRHIYPLHQTVTITSLGELCGMTNPRFLPLEKVQRDLVFICDGPKLAEALRTKRDYILCEMAILGKEGTKGKKTEKK